jgi:predicted nucleic acid-binding Zn ribbon protein
MRQTTGPRKSPGEKIVKDIKRATIARQGIAQQCPKRGASITHEKRRSGSSWTACVAKTALLSCAAHCPAGSCRA